MPVQAGLREETAEGGRARGRQRRHETALNARGCLKRPRTRRAHGPAHYGFCAAGRAPDLIGPRDRLCWLRGTPPRSLFSPLPMRLATLRAAAVGAALFLAPAALAQTAQPLPFSQNWTNTGLITADNDWSGVPGIIGYRGEGLTSTTRRRTRRPSSSTRSATPFNFANNRRRRARRPRAASTSSTIANPVVAFQGSGTADAPHLVIRVVTTGSTTSASATTSATLTTRPTTRSSRSRCSSASARRATYTNVPAGYVADASTGPSLATLVTPVDVTCRLRPTTKPSVDIRGS